MQKPVIKASDLIQTLKNSKTFGSAKALLPHLEKKRSDYELSKGKAVLKVEIDTDEDFSVNGTALFSGHVVVDVEQGETLYEALTRYLSTLIFSPESSSKVFHFKEMILNNIELEETLYMEGSVEIGGNQTLHAYLVPYESIISLDGIGIDLSL